MVKKDKELETKSDDSPGGVTPEAGEPLEGMPVAEPESVPYRKLFRWGWYVVSVALGWFLTNTVLSIFLQILTQYNVQVLATVVSGLGSSFAGGGVASRSAEAAGGAAKMGGFLSAFLPGSLESAAIVFATLALLLILLRFVERIIMTWSDNLMVARLQQRLHDKLLDPGARLPPVP